MDPKRRRELLAQANRLSANITIQAGELSPGAIDHVRTALGSRELLKIRVQGDDAQACDAAGRQLAEAVPCEFVGRVGRVVVLYSPSDESRSADEDDRA
ncbi:MAG: YhbY family RNA-binding protein [Phycisphaerales bacterium]|nr:YhbY family RNA-binding protein [Phycisphaerales bacterium]